MNTLWKFMAATMFAATLGIGTGAAQEEDCADLGACFEKYKVIRKADCGKRADAIKLGKHIGEKFKDEADEQNKKVVAAVVANAAKLEKEDAVCIRNANYDSSFKARNWDQFMSLSRDIINDQSTESGVRLDVLLTAASTGFDRMVVDKSDRFNNDTVLYAKTAIQQIEANVASKTFGTFAPFENRENALGWMNFILGFVNYQKFGATMPEKKKEGVAYLFKASQHGEKKNDWTIFATIGDWYAEQATELFKEYTALRQANNDTENDESKAKLALARGYAERALDAHARAYKLLSADKNAKADDIKGLLDEVTKFYKFRFNGKSEGQDTFVAGLIAKPMPDPTSAVTPVILEEPTTTSTSAATTPASSTTPVTSTAPVKPTVSTTPVKTTTPAQTKPATPATSATKPAATVKKPGTKRKATR